MNLTHRRVRVLKLLQARGELYAGAIATYLVPERKWWPQGATRWGCGYMQPLVDAGLVRKDIYVDSGGAKYKLTEGGRAALEVLE